MRYDKSRRPIEELADDEDLRLLREAKVREKDVPGIGLQELKSRLSIKNRSKRSSPRRSK
jgi:hypothetical protein